MSGNLKLLGQYNRRVGLRYQDVLEEAGVPVVLEDWGNSLEVSGGFSLVRLLVSGEDHEKALNLIKDFEQGANQRLAGGAGKIADQEMLKGIVSITIRCLAVVALIAVVACGLRYYNAVQGMMLLKKGIAESQKGSFAGAVREYSKVIDLFPAFATAYYDRGLAFQKLGNLKKAVDDFTQAIKLRPDDGQSYRARGLVYEEQGDFASANADYLAAARFMPDDVPLNIDLGYSYAQLGDATNALRYLNRAIAIDPKSGLAFQCRAVAHYKANDYEKAWQDIHKAEELGYQRDAEDDAFVEALKKSSILPSF